MTAKEIRESFKKFFESKEHLIVPSAPMVVKDDPTLMFTNAGMNQFKDIILGNVTPKCRRQADTQKCLRVSRSEERRVGKECAGCAEKSVQRLKETGCEGCGRRGSAR